MLISGGPISSAPISDYLRSAAPTLSAVASAGQVVLTWVAGDLTPTSYNVYRGTTSGGETLLTSGIDAGTLTYTDSTVVNGVTYYYQVVGVALEIEGDYSSEVAIAVAGGGGGLPPADWWNRMAADLLYERNMLDLDERCRRLKAAQRKCEADRKAARQRQDMLEHVLAIAVHEGWL